MGFDPAPDHLAKGAIPYHDAPQPLSSWQVLMRSSLLLTAALLPTACGRPTPDGAAAGDALPRREVYVLAPDSVRLFTQIVGSGADTLIVLHGGPGFTHDYLAADLEPLATRHTLIHYDQRGAGRSTLVQDSAALDAARFVDDVETIRAHFGLTRPTLLGHSWGVGIAALYARQYPTRVAQLILVDGVPLRFVDLVAGFETMARARDSTELQAMDRWMATRRAHPEDAAACHAYYRLWFRPFFADSAALSRTRGDFCDGTPESRRNKLEAVDRYTMASLGSWDWRSTMPAISARTLVVHGTLDPIPHATAEEWVRTLPNARLLTLDGIGHFPYLEAPDQFFPAIEAFLAGGWPSTAKALRPAP